MQITEIHANIPGESKELIRLALARGQAVQGGRRDLGRINRDAFTIHIHGAACDAIVSWISSKEDDGRFTLSYARTWDADAKTWQPASLAEVKSLLEGMEVLLVDVPEEPEAAPIPSPRTRRPGLRGTRDVHLPA
ncbi:hypothetical protein [Streptomyces sp. NPDC059828]|uniref:hypothetical protein n=1 Tax=Streptomyces sp. NPDC059828 TaxID=3346965 RepID=UPI0036493443